MTKSPYNDDDFLNAQEILRTFNEKAETASLADDIGHILAGISKIVKAFRDAKHDIGFTLHDYPSPLTYKLESNTCKMISTTARVTGTLRIGKTERLLAIATANQRKDREALLLGLSRDDIRTLDNATGGKISTFEFSPLERRGNFKGFQNEIISILAFNAAIDNNDPCGVFEGAKPVSVSLPRDMTVKIPRINLPKKGRQP